jgi:hypothetical protein
MYVAFAHAIWLQLLSAQVHASGQNQITARHMDSKRETPSITLFNIPVLVAMDENTFLRTGK